jgi:hypothetical protein
MNTRSQSLFTALYTALSIYCSAGIITCVTTDASYPFVFRLFNDLYMTNAIHFWIKESNAITWLPVLA